MSTPARTTCRRSLRVTIRGPYAAPALAEQFGHDRVIDDRDGRQRRDLPVQHAADLAPGGVLGVQHAPDAVGRFARRRRPAIRVAIEARAPVQQLGDVGGTFLDERAHRVRLAQAVTGREGVLEVQARRIVVAHGHGDAALRPPRAALFRFALREDADLSPARERQRRAERSNAAAEYQEIGVRGHQTLLSYHPLRAAISAAPFPLMTPHILEVRTRSAQVSRIAIGPGLLSSLGAAIAEACPGASRLVVVSSPRVWSLHGPAVRHGLCARSRPRTRRR